MTRGQTRRWAMSAACAAAVIGGACGEDGGVTPQDFFVHTPAIVWIADFGNAGDGTDLGVRLRAPADTSLTIEYRLFVAKAPAAGLDTTVALALPADRYVAVPVTGGERTIAFEANMVDHDGDPLVEGVAYRIAVLAVGIQSPEVHPSLDLSSETVTLTQSNYIRTVSAPIQAGSGGMEVDDQGRVYMADFGLTLGSSPGTSIYRMTLDGAVSVFATGFVGASGNSFGSSGTLYQSNIRGQSISSVSADGVVSTHASSGFAGPVGVILAAGSSGGTDTLYVADCGGNTVMRVAPDGTSSTFATSPLFSCPNGIAQADDGKLYVANFNNGDVLQVTPGGTVTLFHTIPGNNNGHILWGNGVLYVVARGENRLYQLTLQGERSLLAGTGTRGARDGDPSSATLSLPNDVALSPDGRTLWFNDVGQATQDPSVISPVLIRALVFVGPQTP